MWPLLAAALWGFAEATFFFLVPDVILSAIAIFDWQLALWACLAATAGALAGGALMYHRGCRDAASARDFLLRLPGVGPRMLERVGAAVGKRGLVALALGPLSGTPYKLYAVECGVRRLSLASFLLVSVPARMARFLLVVLLAAWLAHGAVPGWSPAAKLAAWLAAWCLFYAWYFRAVRRREA